MQQSQKTNAEKNYQSQAIAFFILANNIHF